MPHQPLPIPLYQRVFAILHQRIQQGTYAAGQQLDTETELCSEFGVSKATLRQAMAELVARGMIVRRHGRGTFVGDLADRSTAAPFIGTLSDLTVGSRHLPLRHLTLEAGVPFPLAVQTALQTSHTSGSVVRRTREVGGQVFAHTVQYLSPRIEPLVTADGLRKYGVPTLLHNKGIVLTGAEQATYAEVADSEVARRLEVDLGAPVLYAERVLFSVEGPVEVVRGWYRGDLYRWQTDFNLRWQDDRLVIFSDGRIGDGRDPDP